MIILASAINILECLSENGDCLLSMKQGAPKWGNEGLLTRHQAEFHSHPGFEDRTVQGNMAHPTMGLQPGPEQVKDCQ